MHNPLSSLNKWTHILHSYKQDGGDNDNGYNDRDNDGDNDRNDVFINENNLNSNDNEKKDNNNINDMNNNVTANNADEKAMDESGTTRGTGDEMSDKESISSCSDAKGIMEECDMSLISDDNTSLSNHSFKGLLWRDVDNDASMPSHQHLPSQSDATAESIYDTKSTHNTPKLPSTSRLLHFNQGFNNELKDADRNSNDSKDINDGFNKELKGDIDKDSDMSNGQACLGTQDILRDLNDSNLFNRHLDATKSDSSDF